MSAFNDQSLDVMLVIGVSDHPNVVNTEQVDESGGTNQLWSFSEHPLPEVRKRDDELY